jgi:vancomycin resistance protein YoaR
VKIFIEDYFSMEADFMKDRLMLKKAIIFSILLCFMCVFPSYAFSETVNKKDKKLPKNVYFKEVDLSGKTIKEVEELIDREVEEIENKNINICFPYNGDIQSHNFKLKDLGYYSNKEEVKKKISLILYNDLNPIEKLKEYINIKKYGRKYDLTHGIDYEKFCKSLSVFDESKLPKPQNAKYKYKDGRIIIISETYGYEFDKEKLYNEICSNMLGDEREFTLHYKDLKPKITKEILKKQGIKENIASFTTRFNSNNKSRSKNIRLAASIIDGTIVAPGEVFSFNKVVGERTKARGFDEAGVYINGNIESELGGGICQVSSTLYNAVLLSDLEVVQRNNHSLTVNYVPLSRDAAVSWGSKDFKFRNNKDFYIYIHAETGENTITFDLFGTKSNKRVELISKIIERIDSPIKYVQDTNLKDGEIVKKGRTGYRSKLIKKVYENGKLIKTETVSQDKYMSTPTIIQQRE